MEIVISDTDGYASFAYGYFKDSDADKMKAFAESCGFKCSISHTTDRFRDYLEPLRKKTTRDIDWSDWRVYPKIITMMKADKSYDEIVTALGSQSTGFAVQARCGEIYRMWDKFRDTIQGEPTPADLEKWAKLIAKKATIPVGTTTRKIDKMLDDGCDAGIGEKFPECKAGFSKACFTCPINKKFVKDEADVALFNEVLAEEYEDEE
jgi:hypothetical protein